MPRARPEATTKPAAPERAGQLAGKTAGRHGSLAGADDGQGRPAQQAEIADGRQDRRRIRQGGQRRRIGGIAEHQEAAAGLGQRLFLAGDRGIADRASRAQAARAEPKWASAS